MAKQYIYAAANPIWMNEVKTFNPVYNTLPFDYQVGGIPYVQKVKFGVPTMLQVLSDWLPTLKIYKCETGQVMDTLAPTTPTTGIVGQTFTCYEFTITWGSYPAGTYYIEITYNKSTSSATFNYSLTNSPYINGLLTPSTASLPAGTGYNIHAYGDDPVSGSNMDWSLMEDASPYIDCDLQIKFNGTTVVNATNSSTGAVAPAYNDSIQVATFGLSTTTATTPKLNLVITKDGVTIFSKTVAYVPGSGNAIIKTITGGIGRGYQVNAYTSDGTPDLPNVDSDTPDVANIKLTVTKDGTKIFENVIPYVTGIANGLNKTGIAQPGSVYNVAMITGVNMTAVTPINIADTNPVVPDIVINRSGAIQSAANWPNTLVYEYTNSTNDFSVIFSTGIVFASVIEGVIADYEPGFDDVIYEDQYHNTTKLNAIPYRQFTLYAGSITGFAGLPAYIADKLNWIFGCDQIKIDGVYYQNVEGSKWEVARTPPTGTNFVGLKIGIIEVINLFLQSYQAGEVPAGAIQVVSRTKEYVNNSADITVSGIFTAASLLKDIVIYNHGGDIFTLRASTAADGSAPICPDFTTDGRAVEVWEINEAFQSVQTLYMIGFDGTNTTVYLLYDQLDAPYVAPPAATKFYAKGQVSMYEEVTIGDFTADWNIGTGLGNPGTKFEGCAISGTNGTKDRNGLLAIGWNPSLPLTRDTLVGAANNTVVLQTGNLPSFNLNVGLDLKGGGTGVKVVSSQNPGPGGNGSTNLPYVGAANPVNIANAARVTLYFVCITD